MVGSSRLAGVLLWCSGLCHVVPACCVGWGRVGLLVAVQLHSPSLATTCCTPPAGWLDSRRISLSDTTAATHVSALQMRRVLSANTNSVQKWRAAQTHAERRNKNKTDKDRAAILQERRKKAVWSAPSRYQWDHRRTDCVINHQVSFQIPMLLLKTKNGGRLAVVGITDNENAQTTMGDLLIYKSDTCGICSGNEFGCEGENQETTQGKRID